MAQEIERKFLLASDGWRGSVRKSTRLTQGYLAASGDSTARIRRAGDAAFVTIKGRTSGISRREFEYPIPVADAQVILAEMCEPPLLDKTRHEVVVGDHLWEIDEFHGANAGLIVAEIELGSEDEAFQRPAWLGAEVSGDARYFNVNLVRQPFRNWAPQS